MAVKFICDKCGFEAPRNKVLYEVYEGWFAGDMRVLELFKPYSCRVLCERTRYDENKKVVREGCFHEVIKEENLVFRDYSYKRKTNI